jgi:hypothetical protein
MSAVFILFFAYSYGVYTTSNCALDNQSPKILPTVIAKKYVNKAGDSDSYYLYFVPVQGIDNDNMEVTDAVYNSAEVGDSLYINVKPGRWQSQWYYLSADR